MLINREKTELFCIYCNHETSHEVCYVNEVIASITCNRCGNEMTIDVDAMKEFHHYVYSRLSSKPGRMTEEARNDLNHFLTSLPMRLVSKPLRFSSEYNQLNKEVKKYIETQKKDEPK